MKCKRGKKRCIRTIESIWEIKSRGKYKNKELSAKRVYKFNGGKYIISYCNFKPETLYEEMLDYENNLNELKKSEKY